MTIFFFKNLKRKKMSQQFRFKSNLYYRFYNRLVSWCFFYNTPEKSKNYLGFLRSALANIYICNCCVIENTLCAVSKNKIKKKIWNMYWRFPVLSQRLKSTLFEIFFKWRLRNDKKKKFHIPLIIL